MKSTKSEALRALEGITGGPLTLGRMLAAIREGEGETLAVFARKLGVTRAKLCDVEKTSSRSSKKVLDGLKVQLRSHLRVVACMGAARGELL